jgi:hypothetical protein
MKKNKQLSRKPSQQNDSVLKAEDFVDKIFGCLFLKEQKKV